MDAYDIIAIVLSTQALLLAFGALWYARKHAHATQAILDTAETQLALQLAGEARRRRRKPIVLAVGTSPRSAVRQPPI
jgi:hypothetical protein